VAEGRIKSAAHMGTAGWSAISFEINFLRRRPVSGVGRDRCYRSGLIKTSDRISEREAIFLFAVKDQEVKFGRCLLLAQSRHFAI
jgi:hypothetical protein